MKFRYRKGIRLSAPINIFHLSVCRSARPEVLTPKVLSMQWKLCLKFPTKPPGYEMKSGLFKHARVLSKKFFFRVYKQHLWEFLNYSCEYPNYILFWIIINISTVVHCWEHSMLNTRLLEKELSMHFKIKPCNKIMC